MTDTKKPTLSFCASTLLISQHLMVGNFSPTNRFTSLSVAPVEHIPLEVVYIFFDTATYNEIERDVKVTKDTVPAFRFVHCSALEARQKLQSYNVFMQVTTEAQLGLIGGTMGLLTGFSLLSGIEILYYVVRFFLSLRISRASVVSAAKSKFENHLM